VKKNWKSVSIEQLQKRTGVSRATLQHIIKEGERRRERKSFTLQHKNQAKGKPETDVDFF
jgi:transcriptional antiterminator